MQTEPQSVGTADWLIFAKGLRPGHRYLRRKVRWNVGRTCWMIHFAASMNIERLGDYGAFPTAEAAVAALVAAYPNERWIVRPGAASAHEPGNSLPGGNGTWVKT